MRKRRERLKNSKKILISFRKNGGEKMVLNHMKRFVEEIREHPAADSLPDAFWEELNAVEDWEVYSSRESLPVLSNFDSKDPDLLQLVEEVYEDGISIAEIYEFSEKIAEDPQKTPVEGPTIEVELSEGVVRAYPVWEKYDSIYTLTMKSYDIYLEPEILIIEEKDLKDIDIQEAIVESIRDWVEGE
ncbi:MAG: hypothetical protein H5T41_09900 [Methanomassiliicoccales archaeon]|nr:hypothetical protein [Methanomassiliicoccales archaeon]